MKTKVYENSKVPVFLSYLSPVSWINKILGKPIFEIHAITFGKHIFVKDKALPGTIRHETIHSHQWVETYYIGFLYFYIFDWIKGLLKYKDPEKAYLRIRAEQEAYEYESDKDYLEDREKGKWLTEYEV